MDAEGKGEDRLGRSLQGAVRGDARCDRQLEDYQGEACADGGAVTRDHIRNHAGHTSREASDEGDTRPRETPEIALS